MRSVLPRLSITLALLAFAAILPTRVGAQGYQYLKQWGSQGTGNGQFNAPRFVAVDPAGQYVYVSDVTNETIQKFTSNGDFVTQWNSGVDSRRFWGVTGVAVDPTGEFVYVTEYDGDMIQKFTSDGVYVTNWGTYGEKPGQFHMPFGVAVDAAGNVYVTDYYRNNVQKFTSDGVYITQWGSQGSGDGQFSYPTGVAVDAAGNVYVANNGGVTNGNSAIQEFTSDGVFITQWGSQGSGNGQFGGTGAFGNPFGVAVDAAGNVYVADQWGGIYDNERSEKFTGDGAYITQWGSRGTGNGQFYEPMGVAVDAAGNVYVVDARNYRIQKFGLAPVPTKSESWGRLKALYR